MFIFRLLKQGLVLNQNPLSIFLSLTLPETNPNTPENRPEIAPKGNESSSNWNFSGPVYSIKCSGTWYSAVLFFQ